MSKKKKLGELVTDNKENAAKLDAADIKVFSDKDKTEKKISKLILDNRHNSNELDAAYKIIVTQEKEIKKQAEALIRANKEKEKQRTDLISAQKELAHKAELIILNKELTLQIDERKLAEAELNDSRDEIYRLLNSIYEGVYGVDINGNCTFVNQSFLQLLGYQNDDELLGKHLHELIHHSHYDGSPYPSSECKAYKAYEANQIFNCSDEFYWRKDGVGIPVEYWAHPIEKDGVVIGSIVTFIDITERKLAEDALKQREYSYRTLSENLPASVYRLFLRERGKMEFFNDVIEQITGYTKDELKIGEICSIDPFIIPEDKPQVMEIVKNAIKNVSEFEVEYRFKRKEGYISYFYEKGMPIIGEDGKPLYIEGVIFDITERKNAESELIKAKEKAEESDRLKSAFLTNLSHEMRTPMNGILGFTELLQEPNLSSENKKDFMQIIQTSSARMLNTINSIVNMSKIESGLIKVDINETNINEKIEFIYKFLKPEVETKGLQFLFKNGLPTNEAIIKTDDEKVDEILTNLVRNAIKFTGEGSIYFGYVLKSDSEPAELEFFVKDTGIGIPQKLHQLIFERFRQGSESHSRGYEGSGLGLSISKYYVEMLGGKIWVESEEDRGSTFYFTIPYNPVSEIETEVINSVSAEHKKVTLENMKILIVEDNEISFTLLKLILYKISKEVLHAHTGAEAVETCRNNPDIDLILMDIRMPRMNGLEATQKIRQFNKEVIIIAQTAYAFLDDSEKAIEAGCNDYIMKPINKTILREKIKKHVSN